MCKDLCDEERRFAEELRSHFDIEAEDLPPFYVEAMLGSSEENLAERLIKRTYARLGLERERVSGQREGISLLNRWINLPALGFKQYATIACGFLIVLVLVLFVAQQTEVYAKEPPHVLRTFPADGAKDVPKDAPIVIFLDREITPDTRYTVTLIPPQKLLVSARGQVMVIEPSGTVRALRPSETIRVHLVFQTEGGRSSEHSFSFVPVGKEHSTPTIYYWQE